MVGWFTGMPQKDQLLSSSRFLLRIYFGTWSRSCSRTTLQNHEENEVYQVSRLAGNPRPASIASLGLLP